jgi:hypothetical protein
MAYAGGRESINNKKTGKKLTTAPFRQNNDASVRRTGITTTVLNDILT